MDRRRVGVLPGDSPELCEAIGAMDPHTDETRDTATAPAVVGSAATDPFITPPTREQLMVGSANLRRVYKFDA